MKHYYLLNFFWDTRKFIKIIIVPFSKNYGSLDATTLKVNIMTLYHTTTSTIFVRVPMKDLVFGLQLDRSSGVVARLSHCDPQLHSMKNVYCNACINILFVY